MPIVELQDAIREAYAAAPSAERILSTLELRHEALAGPIRMVRAPGEFIEHDEESGLDIYGYNFTLEDNAPIDGGEEVLFQALMFRFRLPSQSDARISGFEITIDNATKYISKELDTIVTIRSPMYAVYREYLISDVAQPSLIIGNMTVKKVRSTLAMVTATAEFADLVNKKFPSILYRPEEFRGLVG